MFILSILAMNVNTKYFLDHVNKYVVMWKVRMMILAELGPDNQAKYAIVINLSNFQLEK